MDVISITDLALTTPHLSPDLWQRERKLQPLLLSLSIFTSITSEASRDTLLSDSLNYGTVTKCIETGILNLEEKGNLGYCLEELAEILVKLVIFECGAINISLKLSQPRALLTAEAVGVSIYRQKSDYTFDSNSVPVLNLNCNNFQNDSFFITGLSRYIIIGINECERIDEQQVLVELEFGSAMSNSIVRQGWKNWRLVTKSLERHLSTSKPLTIESLTTDLAKIILTPSTDSRWNVPKTTVKISKPSALQFAKYPSVQITRTTNDFNFLESRTNSSLSGTTSLSSSFMQSGTSTNESVASSQNTEAGGMNSVILGIGSNLGIRLDNINLAIEKLAEVNISLLETSFLYESTAMYLESQPKFLNAVLKVETIMEPLELLQTLKGIENSIGRQKTIRNGPRLIDLDILFYNKLILNIPKQSESDDRWLQIPHISIAEREFVLRPLVDLTTPLIHPSLQQTPQELLNTLLETIPTSLQRVLPLSTELYHPLSSKTLIMSIINATPDSFSDGGDNATLENALKTVLEHIELGVDIIDIGGMSTRPGAAEVLELEELNRVVPLIKAIRLKNSKIPISIDTFNPSVALAAIKAGATIINDVLGGTKPGMLSLMSKLNVPVILMHSRGTPQTMSNMTQYPNGVIKGVQEEMNDRIQNGLQVGIKKWNIILDPGIGFAKTHEDNLTLLKHLNQVLESTSTTSSKFPSLVGLSRKKFLGTITNKPIAKERIWGTAVGVSCCIQNGTDIVRIHDVVEMLDVVKVADAIYRK